KISDNEFVVRVNAPAKEGRANEAVIAALSGYFGIPKSRIRIALAETSSLSNALAGGWDSPETSQRYTVSLWVKPNSIIDSSVTQFKTIFGYGGAFLMGFSYQGNPAGTLTVHTVNFWYNTHENIYTLQNVWNSNEWYHIATTFDRPLKKIYVNGTLVASTSWDHELDDWWFFGAFGWQNEASFYGLIDDAAVWTKALSKEEINAVGQMGVGRAYALTGSDTDLSTAIEKLGYLMTANSSLNLNYTQSQINELIDIYTSQNASGAVIDGITWTYIAHDDPIWTGHNPGDAFTVNGVKYILLGGGLGGQPLGGGEVPEPSTVAGLLGTIILIFYRRIKKSFGF
ncbi:MAG: DUF167 family protein, partial [Candidatus Omnitrophica bacterium]|nr:DUF167 family protein [Candidatus Omnitrophota bacterium]